MAACDHPRRLGILHRSFQPGGREDGDVHVQPSLVEDTPLERPADSGWLEEGEQRPAERLDPPLVAEVAIGLVDDKRQVDVRPRVGRRVGTRARADEEHGAHVVAGLGPADERLQEQLPVQVAPSTRWLQSCGGVGWSSASGTPRGARTNGSASRAESSAGQSRGYSPRLCRSPPGMQSSTEIRLSPIRIKL